MRRKRRIMRARLIIAALVVLILAAIVLLGVFRIHTVEIIGNERYSGEEIRSNLIYNFTTENTLFFCWKYRHARSDERAPYLDSIQAKLVSPGRVRLIVREKRLVGYVVYAGSNVFFDSKGEVLDITDETYSNIPSISGVAMDEPILYQKLPLENNAQLQTIRDLTDLLLQENLGPDNISFDDNSNITLQFGNVDVRLGQNEYLPEKISNLVTLLPAVEGQSGVLNMEAYTGKNEPITLRPKEEETSGGDGNGSDTAGDGASDNGQPGDGYSDGVSGDGSGYQDGYSDGASGDGSGYQDGYSNGASGDGSGYDDGSATSGWEDGGISQDGEAGQAEDTSAEEQVTTGLDAFMVFDSSGTLRYDAHVVNGQVVDAYGNPIDGCTVTEEGYVKDAYWNIIDPQTGTLAEQ